MMFEEIMEMLCGYTKPNVLHFHFKNTNRQFFNSQWNKILFSCFSSALTVFLDNVLGCKFLFFISFVSLIIFTIALCVCIWIAIIFEFLRGVRFRMCKKARSKFLSSLCVRSIGSSEKWQTRPKFFDIGIKWVYIKCHFSVILLVLFSQYLVIFQSSFSLWIVLSTDSI